MANSYDNKVAMHAKIRDSQAPAICPINKLAYIYFNPPIAIYQKERFKKTLWSEQKFLHANNKIWGLYTVRAE